MLRREMNRFDSKSDQVREIPNEKADRRRHKRVDLQCLGRFMRQDRTEYTCKLINISVGGAALHSPQSVDIGEHVVAYFDEIGRIDGPVVRLVDGGFAMQIQATQHRREKLAAQLTWLINRKTLGIPDSRRHDRIEPKKIDCYLVLPNGSQVYCRILDISVSGASLYTEHPPAIGTDVTIGKLRAKIVRHHEHGVGVQFLDIQHPLALRKHFG